MLKILPKPITLIMCPHCREVGQLLLDGTEPYCGDCGQTIALVVR